MIKIDILNKLKDVTEKLGYILKEDSVDKLHLNSLGNSIASGYSYQSKMAPLFNRNIFLEDIFSQLGIELEINHFARSQSNCDELTFNYFIQDISVGEIHKFNRSDALKEDTPIKNLTDKILDEYYPTDKTLTINNSMFTHGSTTSSICVYCGGTGTFLDKFSRSYNRDKPLEIIKGSIQHSPHTFSYFKNDNIHMHSVMNYFQSKNRLGANTQVYLGGFPNYLSLNLTAYPTHKIKKMSEKYANSSFVKGAKSKLFYPSIDIHYNEDEYLLFSINIFESIINNYFLKNSLIAIDRDLYKLNKDVDLSKLSLQNQVYNIIEKELEYLSKHKCDEKEFLILLSDYINIKYQNLFHLLDCKKAIKKYIK